MTPRFFPFAFALLCACSSSDPQSPADVPDASTPAKDASVDTGGGGDAPAAETAKCAADETACGGACVKLISDAMNCGKCGKACGADETCTGGSCQCPTGKTKCGAACVDTKADGANCGACGTACADKETCSDGKCYAACPTGQTRCGAACVDLTADAKNCGACAKACATGEACNSGACGIACEYPTKSCSGKCVNVGFDVDNCGDCGKKCDTGSNGTPGCTSSSCVFTCTAPYANCDDDVKTNGCETNLQNSDKHCGACFKACAATETCLSAKCECKSGNLRCGAACVDVTTDATNCGGCGKVCATGESCSASACQCSAGFTRCPAMTGTCVDMKADPKNCGACGTVCPGTNVCSNGLCCPSGQTNCGGVCVDLAADASNCGVCGKTCDAMTPYCSASSCSATCGGGLTACGTSCTNLTSDVKNCGACAKACLAGEQCIGSACVMLGFPGSTIIDSVQGSKVNAWIGTPGQNWKLCYSKALNGATTSAFHTGCDGKGASVTLAKLSTGRIIGGYNALSWTSGSGAYGGSSSGFLFSITNDFKHAFPGTSSGSYWTYNNTSYGPTFGGGHDFYVSSTMNSGYCNIGFTYACRTGMGAYGSTTCQNDFCGTYSSWTIDALEVWVK